MKDRDKLLLELVDDNINTIPKLANHTDLSTSTIHRRLSSMEKFGLVKRDGFGELKRGRPPDMWEITERGKTNI